MREATEVTHNGVVALKTLGRGRAVVGTTGFSLSKMYFVKQKKHFSLRRVQLCRGGMIQNEEVVADSPWVRVVVAREKQND